MPPLPLARYRARFAADGPVHFGDFPGNAWRGALGHALRRTVCVTRAPACTGCMRYRSCLYPYFFETPPAADAAMLRTNLAYQFGRQGGDRELAMRLADYVARHHQDRAPGMLSDFLLVAEFLARNTRRPEAGS